MSERQEQTTAEWISGLAKSQEAEIERLKEELSNESSLRIEETQRLRALADEKEKAIVRGLEIEAGLRQCIEELEKQVDGLNRMRVHCDNCGGDYLATGLETGCPCQLIKRIEELEKENEVCDQAYEAMKANPPKIQFFTHEQIDAAVEELRSQVHFNGLLVEERRMTAIRAEEDEREAWAVLRPLGIERCEGCDGVGQRDDETDIAILRFFCDDCDGHGWTIGGEDE